MLFCLFATHQAIMPSMPEMRENIDTCTTQIQQQDSKTYSRFKNGFGFGVAVGTAVILADRNEEFHKGTHESTLLLCATCLWTGVVFGSIDVAIGYCSDFFNGPEVDVS